MGGGGEGIPIFDLNTVLDIKFTSSPLLTKCLNDFFVLFQVKKRTKRVSELFQSYHPYTHKVIVSSFIKVFFWEDHCAVVECFNMNYEVLCSNPAVTELCPWARYLYPTEGVDSVQTS